MPIIKSAKKKLRQDIKREKHNRLIKETYKEALKTAKLKPTGEAVKKAVSQVAKAAKKGIIHKNKAARLISKLSRLDQKPSKKKEPETKKTAKRKTTRK